MNANELNNLVEEYVGAREIRLAADREAAKLKELEEGLKVTLIREMRAQNTFSIGRKSRVTLTPKNKPVTSDWAKLYEYIKANDAFDLLQRRLTETAVTARWEDGITIPGITTFPVDQLSISKV